MSHSSFLCNDPSVFMELPRSNTVSAEIPFDDAESAWFWCVRISDAIHSGARSTRDATPSAWGSASRPCEAVDIQKIVLRMAQQKILTERHIHVLTRYGKNHARPAGNSPAYHYWQQAMNHLTPVLQRKGIITS